MTKHTITASIIAGIFVSIIAAQSLSMFGGGSPSIWSPTSMILYILACLGRPPIIGVVLFAVIYWVWTAGLFQGKGTIPLRTTVLFVISAVMSLAWYAIGWRYGVHYEGLNYTVTCAILGASQCACCAIMLIRTKRAPSFMGSLVSHALLFCWLALYAFPYLGEA